MTGFRCNRNASTTAFLLDLNPFCVKYFVLWVVADLSESFYNLSNLFLFVFFCESIAVNETDYLELDRCVSEIDTCTGMKITSVATHPRRFHFHLHLSPSSFHPLPPVPTKISSIRAIVISIDHTHWNPASISSIATGHLWYWYLFLFLQNSHNASFHLRGKMPSSLSLGYRSPLWSGLLCVKICIFSFVWHIIFIFLWCSHIFICMNFLPSTIEWTAEMLWLNNLFMFRPVLLLCQVVT